MSALWVEIFLFVNVQEERVYYGRVVASLAFVGNSSPATLVRLRIVASVNPTAPVLFTCASKGQRISSSIIQKVGIMLSIFCGIGKGLSRYLSVYAFRPY